MRVLRQNLHVALSFIALRALPLGQVISAVFALHSAADTAVVRPFFPLAIDDFEIVEIVGRVCFILPMFFTLEG